MKTREIIHNIKERMGIEQLNAMQIAMSETDKTNIVLIAPTGSGKTLAFIIRMLRTFDLKKAGQGVQALVIAPSRELVVQIAEIFRRVAVGLKVTPLYGGHRFDDEAKSLSVVPDIVVATPGRLLDHLQRATISLNQVELVTLDEYDKSLELGFEDEMKRIMRQAGRPTLRMLTSATLLEQLPPFISDRHNIEVMDFTDRSGAPTVPVPIVEVPSPVPDKLNTLTDLLHSLHNGKAIIFANHRESAERIYRHLAKQGLPAGLYHGALDQTDRRHALRLFANGSTPILVTTDLGARGLDIPEVESVIHYHLPINEATWTHRNGRTARQGARGTVYAIISDGETIPQFVGFDRAYTPKGESPDPIRATTATIHFNLGKKEKISKADILGYLTKTGGLSGSQVGNITVDDHESTAAVPVDEAAALISRLAHAPLKGKRVRTTPLLPLSGI